MINCILFASMKCHLYFVVIETPLKDKYYFSTSKMYELNVIVNY